MEIFDPYKPIATKALPSYLLLLTLMDIAEEGKSDVRPDILQNLNNASGVALKDLDPFLIMQYGQRIEKDAQEILSVSNDDTPVARCLGVAKAILSLVDQQRLPDPTDMGVLTAMALIGDAEDNSEWSKATNSDRVMRNVLTKLNKMNFFQEALLH